jgi:osmoprotectant transport system ATP-binding protein
MDEALRLATGMAVMNGGRLIQTGCPASIPLAPVDDFVRDFFRG